MSIEERIAAVIDRHREAFDRDAYRSECSCGNWTEESFDDAGGHLTHAGHVASVLVAELGLTQLWRAEADGCHGQAQFTREAAESSLSVIERTSGTWEQAKGYFPDFGQNPRIATRYATPWMEES